MKRNLFSKIKQFNGDERGVTAIEYAVILSFISGSLLIVLPPTGIALASTFDSTRSVLQMSNTADSQSIMQSGQQSTPAKGNCQKSGGKSSKESSKSWWR